MFYHKWIGKRVANYQIVDLIGVGRYGVCYLATNPDHIPVVLKYFKPSIFRKNKEKNQYEAVLLSQIDHPKVPKLLGVVNENKFYAYVLELMPGKTFEHLLFKEQRQFSLEEIYQIGLQLIDILQYLHQRGIVHRDIRIPNVLLYEQQVSLIDFGLARWVDGNKYHFDQDFSYLGDFLLFLHYSTFTKKTRKSRPWYKELDLTPLQIQFYKRLLRLNEPYTSIDEVALDFIEAFSKTI